MKEDGSFIDSIFLYINEIGNNLYYGVGFSFLILLILTLLFVSNEKLKDVLVRMLIIATLLFAFPYVWKLAGGTL